jgi:GNAT superfamily N-acetyltransferase
LATKVTFEIEEVADVKEAWSDLEPLVAGIIDYHKPWDHRRLREDWRERIRDHLASATEGLTLLARDNAGAPIAFLDGAITRDYGIFDEVVAAIDNTYVANGARGSGVGKALVGRFEAWARERGATEVRLNVQAGNTLGEEFWQARGFNTFQHRLSKPLESAL